MSIHLSGYIKKISKLAIGTSIAQSITILIAPVLTRFYSPAEYGFFTFFISVASGLAIISTLRYDLAIILPETDKEASGVVSLSFLLNTGFAALLLLAVIIYRLFFAAMLPMDPLLLQWLWFLPVFVFFLGLGNIFQNWFNRKKRYTQLSVNRIINSAGTNLTTLALGIAGAGAWGLFFGNLTGLILFILFFGWILISSEKHVMEPINPTKLKATAGKFRDLPMANTPQTLLEVLQFYGITYLLKIFFTSTIVGWYGLSLRVLQAPLYFLGTSVSQVFYREAAEEYAMKGEFRSLMKKTLRISALAAFPVMLIILVTGPALFAFIFGSEWRESGRYAQILAPWLFFDFIRYPVAQTPLIVGKAKLMFYITMAGTACVLLSMIAGGWIFHDIRTGFIILAALMSIYDLGVITWMYRLSGPAKAVKKDIS